MPEQLPLFERKPEREIYDRVEPEGDITILSINDSRRTFTKMEKKRWAGCYKVIWTPKPKYAASGDRGWFTVYLNDPDEVKQMRLYEQAEEIIVVGQIPEALT